MADNLIVLTTLRLTSENIISKIQTATDEEKKEIFQNTEFRKFIITQALVKDLRKVLETIDDRSADYLFDNDFANMFVKECKEFNSKVSYLSSFLNRGVFKSLKDKDCFFTLMQKPSFADEYFANAKLSYDEMRVLLKKVLSDRRLVGDETISIIQQYFYPKRYNYQNIASYSENLQAIQDMQEILSNPEIFKMYSENFSLMSSLSPENREYLYKDVDYAQMDENQRHMIFKLIANNIQFRIPRRIYTNPEFIDLIAQLQDISEYRNCINNLSDNNIEAMKLIEAKRNEIYDEMMDRFVNDKLSKRGDLVYDDKTKEKVRTPNVYSKIYEFNGKRFIYDKFFAACPRNAFFACGVIYDAMHTNEEFGEILSQEEREIVETIIEMFNLEIETYKVYNNLNNSTFRTVFEQRTALNDINGPNIISNELYYKYQELCIKFRDIESKLPNKSIAQTLGKMLKLARISFAKELSDSLYTPKDKCTRIENGVKIYDITNKNFHCLVHSESHKDFNYAEVPEGDHNINISMSLIDRNHLVLFADGLCFGYSNINGNQVLHALYEDSFTRYASKNDTQLKSRFRDAITNYVPSYLDIDDFMANTDRYNEIKIKAIPNATDDKGRKIFKADYILALDTIRDFEYETAKKLDIPIVFIDSNKIYERYPAKKYEPVLKRKLTMLEPEYQDNNGEFNKY